MIEEVGATEAAPFALPCLATLSLAGSCFALPHPYLKKLEKLLVRMGGIYHPSDILLAINDGRMQSFSENDSWSVTQVVDFPRARVLEILIVVGDIGDCRKLLDRILQYAERNNIGLVQAFGRRGWLDHPLTVGWKIKTRSFLYQREL